MDLKLENAKIFSNGVVKEGGMVIDGGKIVKIAKEGKLPPADDKIDCKGNLILPGLIDVHVHLRDLELSYKEDFLTGTRAALAGGVTTILDMPNTKPITDNPEIFESKLKKASKKIVCNVGFYSAIPEKIQDLIIIAHLGAIGFKIYPDHPHASFNFNDDGQLTSLFSHLKDTHLTTVIHAEKIGTKKLIDEYKKENFSDIDAFLKAHDNQCESMTIQRCLNLIRSDDLKLHFAHVSAAESVQAIIEAKKRGLDFSAEVTPHHLLLDSTLLQSKKAFAKMVPPLRTSNDRNALWDGLNSGFIDILATDHAPHSFKEKKQDFLNAPSGIPGLETSLSLMMTCVNRNMMTLRKFVELTSENPARIFQINNKGKILENFDADLVVVDKHKKSKIDPETFYSKAHHTPFEGLEVQGIPIMTILAGRIVMKNGDILAKEGTGTIIKPQKKSMLV